MKIFLGMGLLTQKESILKPKLIGYSNFIQNEPQHENSYSSDAFLRWWMKNKIPGEIFHNIGPD